MIVDDQREVLDFLSSAAAYAGRPDSVERIDTHGATVFLAGDRAYKLKRAVRYDYMDFSTLERRRAACEAEVDINRRTAPDLYLGALPVTRAPDGGLVLGGNGTPIDWVVEMRRFDQSTLLDRQATRGDLNAHLMITVADAIARLHRSAPPRADHGGPVGMQWVIDGNTAGLLEDGASALEKASVLDLQRRADAENQRHAELLDRRRRTGSVRQCHGDLHLRNICVVNGRSTLFDAVEFNDEIACVDVMYDLAFLVMDLCSRGLPDLANALLNRYLDLTDDFEGLALLPLFLSCRAAVRAKTSASAARVQVLAADTARLHARARTYLTVALAFLRPAPARVVAIGGLSGSGKSTLAVGLAPIVGPAPGAVICRSDTIRKRLCGVEPTDRLEPGQYSDEMNARVYQALAACVTRVVRAGHAAIADATFIRLEDRAALESHARTLGVPFTGLWIDVPTGPREARVAGRVGGASDATVEVLRTQLAQPTGSLAWPRLDGSGAPERVRQDAERLVGRDAEPSSS